MKKKKMVLVAALVITMSISLTGCKSSDYKKGVEYQESGEYSSALEMYKGIDGYENYKDTAERVETCEVMINAIEQYNTAKTELESKNTELETLISDSEALVAEGKTALDETLIPALETSISETKTVEQEVPDMPDTADSILSTAEAMNAVDYTDAMGKLNDSKAALEKSIKQYELVDNPTEAYVIECLQKVEHVADISAVTEDNDPNGQLNKPGGYTATVYYSDDRISLDSSIYGTSVIEQGTDGGGAIEVYSTVEDAEKRRDYLAAYDGGIFASGTHTVIGTVLVRTSNELKGSEQQDMEAKIIAALTYVE
jgi:hypothetical protein